MRVDTHISGCSTQTLALAVRNMLLGLGVAILLGHAKVDHVHQIGVLGVGSPNQKVVRLNISIDQVLLVDSLDSEEL